MPWRDAPHGWQHGVVARRSLSHPTDLASFFVCAPAAVTLAQVVQVAGTRGQVEEAFEVAKQQVGLDEYEVRHWDGWYRHITLSMFALAFLTVVKVTAQKGGDLGARGRRSSPPIDRARSAALIPLFPLERFANAGGRFALVTLASPPSSTR